MYFTESALNSICMYNVKKYVSYIFLLCQTVKKCEITAKDCNKITGKTVNLQFISGARAARKLQIFINEFF